MRPVATWVARPGTSWAIVATVPLRGATAGEQDPAAEADRGEVGAGDVEPARRPDLPRGGIDRDDPVGHGAHVGAAAADHIGEPADHRGRGMGRRGGQRPEPADGARGRVEAEHRGARRPGRERAAGDHDRPADRGDSGVADRAREVRDDVRGAARLPGDDRVEPARPGVAADDVGGAADRRRPGVRARRRQAPAPRSRVPSQGRSGGSRRAASCRRRRRTGRRRRRS